MLTNENFFLPHENIHECPQSLSELAQMSSSYYDELFMQTHTSVVSDGGGKFPNKGVVRFSQNFSL